MTKANTRVKLTRKIIADCPVRDSRYFINDNSVRGLRLRISPNGIKRYVAIGRVRKTSKTRTKTLGDASLLSLDDARFAAREFLSHLQLGVDANEEGAIKLIEQANNAFTLKEAMDIYLADRKLKPKTVASYLYEIPMYCGGFLLKPVNRITEDEVCKWYLENDHIPTSIDKAFRSLRAILEYMVGTKVLSHNPCAAITTRKLRYKIKPKTTRIESHELTGFIDAWVKLMVGGGLNEVQGDFILWLLMTGCRLNEARTMEWVDIDPDQLIITIFDTKNDNPHVIPLTPLMSDLLDRRKKNNPRGNPYVFPAMQGRGYSAHKHLSDCRKALDKITNLASILRIRPHDIRRSFTSILDELDVSHSSIKALLNHNDGTVTRRHYLQATSIEIKRRNLWAVGKHLEKAVTINGKHPKTGESCVFACVGSIREAVYKTAKCNFDIIKENKSAKSILDAMR